MPCALDAAHLRADLDLERRVAVLRPAAARRRPARSGTLMPARDVRRAADDLQRRGRRRRRPGRRSAGRRSDASRPSSTWPTTTPVNGGATGATSSTSRPHIVSAAASASVVRSGSTNVRSQDSDNCMARSARVGGRRRWARRRTRSAELFEEAQVAFEEQAQVVDAVAQHRQALDAAAEREADVALRVEAEVARRPVGCTWPEPEISSQRPASGPVSKRMSISADGSVNGKYDGRKRTDSASVSKNALQEVV